jgi:hypothetical protein
MKIGGEPSHDFADSGDISGWLKALPSHHKSTRGGSVGYASHGGDYAGENKGGGK